MEAIARDHKKQLANAEMLRKSLPLHVHAWADPAHALLEILQNADDSGPRPGKDGISIDFRFEEDGFVVDHDGCEFCEEDVKGISGIGNTTKSSEKHIGFMGIGFKSVYSFSSEAQIVSGPYSFAFRTNALEDGDLAWIVLPSWSEDPPVKPSDPGNTSIFIRYKTSIDDKVKWRIEQALAEDFPAVCLMFLQHIRVIRILVRGDTVRIIERDGAVVTDSRPTGEKELRFRVFRRSFPVPEDVRRDYWVVKSERASASAREISMVSGLDTGGTALTPIQPPSVFAFLPTEQVTELPFVVQADFILDSQRSKIDQNSHWNRWLLSSAADLLFDAVLDFKRGQETKYTFFSVMPSDDGEAEEFIRENMLERFWEKCKKSRIVPSKHNSWIEPEQACFASEALQKVIDTAKLRQLILRSGYVHHKVRSRSFLRSLGVDSFEDRRLLDALEDDAWLSRKSIAWFKEMYRLLLSHLFGEQRRSTTWWQDTQRLKGMRIVPTAQSTLASPSTVLFPPNSQRRLSEVVSIPGLSIAHPDLRRGTARLFLEKLEVGGYEPEQAIRRVVLPQVSSGEWLSWTRKQRESVLRLVANWLRSVHWHPGDLARGLSGVPLPTTEQGWRPANQLHVRTPQLERLIGKQPWAAERSEDQFPEWKRLLDTLGVTECPRVVERGTCYVWSKAEGLTRWNEYCDENELRFGTSPSVSDVVSLPILDDFSLSKSRTVLLGRLLIKQWLKYYSRFTKSNHSYTYRRSTRIEAVESYFAWQLKNSAWLPTTRGIRTPGPDVFLRNSETEPAFGRLPTYLSLRADTAQDASGLWKALDLQSGVSPASVASVMRLLPDIALNANVRRQIGKMYGSVGRMMARQRETGQETDWDAELRHAPMLCDDDTFADPSGDKPLWSDGDDAAHLFEGALPFVWYPLDVERAALSAFFESCGVSRFSEMLRGFPEAETKEQAKFDQRLTNHIRGRSALLSSCVAHRNSSQAESAHRTLRKLRVYRANQVTVTWRAADVERSGQVLAFLDPTSAEL